MLQGVGTGGLRMRQFEGPEELALAKGPGGADQALYVAESGTFRVQQLVSTDAGGHWWDVAVPEVSERSEVRAARAAYEAALKSQRLGD